MKASIEKQVKAAKRIVENGGCGGIRCKECPSFDKESPRSNCKFNGVGYFTAFRAFIAKHEKPKKTLPVRKRIKRFHANHKCKPRKKLEKWECMEKAYQKAESNENFSYGIVVSEYERILKENGHA